MSIQNYERLDQKVAERFQASHRAKTRENRLNLSWSNWCFGNEPLELSLRRLSKAGIDFIELHGNHYGPDIGYKVPETRRLLDDAGIRCAGICGMFSAENDLSSSSGISRQNAVDYLKRTLDFASGVDAGYVLVVPAAVGRPVAYDQNEFDRSAATLRLVADDFLRRGIKAAIEPIRCDETSFCHSVADAKKYIQAVSHPGIQHINGDVYHMQSGEVHIGCAILEADDTLVNLHLADSNRRGLGDGALDLDTVLRALYAIGFHRCDCFCTLEPLGPGGNPYQAMHDRPDPAQLDRLVMQTARYFREREELIRGE